jgi:hypothetical protein
MTVVKEREFAKRFPVQLSDFSTSKAFTNPDDFGFAGRNVISKAPTRFRACACDC